MCWRRADHELNYRRFFAINTLAGMRVELPAVFDASHAEIVSWVRDGLADGLRVDHPDGLADPGGYLDALAAATDGAYVLVEKILEGDEPLPAHWRTAGTTGYDALATFDRLFVDPAAGPVLDALDAEVRGDAAPPSWLDMIHDTKRAVADGILNSEVRRLVRELRRDGVDGASTDDQLADALAELLACFPVYRSYLPLGEHHLRAAAADAVRRRPELAATIDAVVTHLADPANPAAVRFQQTSGMVMAKGVEDCAFYRFTRLGSLTEVGADPDELAVDAAELHRRNDRPAGRVAGGDDHADDPRHQARRGHPGADHRAERDPRPVGLGGASAARAGPARRRTVGAAGVAGRRRHVAGVARAPPRLRREGGPRGRNVDPVDRRRPRVRGPPGRRGRRSVRRRRGRAPWSRSSSQATGVAGWRNGLGLKLVQLTAPGVPDVYQGSELWETSLVDPDNRRPVDFAERRALLARLDDGWLPPIDEGGAAKLLVTSRALRLRRDRPELFTTYRPLEVVGEAADHAVAFDRGGAVTVVTRLSLGLERRGGWGDTAIVLADGHWHDVLTDRIHDGGTMPLDDLLDTYPVALLVPV